jgi:hypothetical protein
MAESVPPCASDAHCYHADTGFPAPGHKETVETCCHCGAVRTFRWVRARKAGHGPFAAVWEWAPDPDPRPAYWPPPGASTVLL